MINTREIIEKWAQDHFGRQSTGAEFNIGTRIMAALAAAKESAFQPAPIMMVGHQRGHTVMFVIGGEVDSSRVSILNPNRPAGSEGWCLDWDRVTKIPSWAHRAVACEAAPKPEENG